MPYQLHITAQWVESNLYAEKVDLGGTSYHNCFIVLNVRKSGVRMSDVC